MAIALVLAGCSPNGRIIGANFGTSQGVATTGNLRLISERNRGDGTPPVVCTEPSPDYIAALSTKVTANVTVNAPSQTSGTGNFELDQKEVITPGAGRTAGVVALRDGLFAACQAYANGLIGQDAYAIILSQYGSLLVELVGGDDDRSIVADKSMIASPGTPGQKSVAQRNPLLSAITVACISGHDPTRSPALVPNNALLDRTFCRNVLQGAVRFALRNR